MFFFCLLVLFLSMEICCSHSVVKNAIDWFLDVLSVSHPHESIRTLPASKPALIVNALELVN